VSAKLAADFNLRQTFDVQLQHLSLMVGCAKI